MRALTPIAAAVALAACGHDAEPIVIGVTGPFSQPRGVSMQRGAQLAADEINGQGGVRGRSLQLVFADDSAGDSVAVRIAHDLVGNAAVVAVVGHLTSGTSLAAGRVYGAGPDPLPMISPSASSPDLSGLNPYVFRICPSDLSHGDQLARYARRALDARRVGVIYTNDDYGRGLRRSFVAEFTRLGGTVLEEDPTLPRVGSLEPYLARMRASGGVDALMLATERTSAERALRDLAALGVAWRVIGGDALTGIEATGPLADGVRVSSAYLADRPGERNVAFVAAYARAYGGDRPDHRGAGAYDIIHLLARALRAVEPHRRALRDYLAGVGRDSPAFEGVTGTIAFDARGDVPAKSVVIGVARGGRLVTEVGP